MAVIGIDLGTTNSLVSCWKEGKSVLIPNSFGDFLTPSVVSVDENGELLVGKIAKERLITHPDATATGFKQYMGTAKQYTLGEQQLRPEDLSALVLRKLKEDAQAYLGEEVTEAVISVPAYFGDVQRTATKNAGTIAGLRVERIINEPSAASIAYQQGLDGDGTFLVLDFGGGTLDVSIVEMFANIVDILAVSGNNRLGGNDIDRLIFKEFLNRHPGLEEQLSVKESASLLKIAEQCKQSLTDNPVVLMVYERLGISYSMELNNQMLADICGSVLAKMQEVVLHAMRDAGQNLCIDEVILVGGSCRMPLVQSYVRHITGKKPLFHLDPDQVVAKGIGIVTGIKQREDQVRDLLLTDICPFTLGISVFNELDFRNSLFSAIIPRNSALPCSREEVYTTTVDGQNALNTRIFQGESLYVKENVQLGRLSVPVPPLPAGEAQLQVRFTYDINGILEVEAYCPQNGVRHRKLIVSNNALSPEEVEQRLLQLKKLKTPAREQEENRLLLARGERMYQEAEASLHKTIELVIGRFEAALKQGNPAMIEKVRRKTSEFFDRIEGNLINEENLHLFFSKDDQEEEPE